MRLRRSSVRAPNDYAPLTVSLSKLGEISGLGFRWVAGIFAGLCACHPAQKVVRADPAPRIVPKPLPPKPPTPKIAQQLDYQTYVHVERDSREVLDAKFPHDRGLLIDKVPGLQPGQQVVAVSTAGRAVLDVTDRRCPPGFDDCLECGYLWAEYRQQDSWRPEPGDYNWQLRGPLEPGMQPDASWVVEDEVLAAQELPPTSFGVFSLLATPGTTLLGFGGEVGGDALAFERDRIWPAHPVAGQTYVAVDERGVLGKATAAKPAQIHDCGFMLYCWLAAPDSWPWARPAKGRVVLLGPIEASQPSGRLFVPPRPKGYWLFPGPKLRSVRIEMTRPELRIETIETGCYAIGLERGHVLCTHTRLCRENIGVEKISGFPLDIHHAQPHELCEQPVDCSGPYHPEVPAKVRR